MNPIWLMLGLAVISPHRNDALELACGAARIDITPPLELKASLGGYGERMNRPASGVHDRVWAKALVIRQGTKRFALVTADVLGIPPQFKGALLETLSKDGWRAGEVMLLPSHSHTSIDMSAINPKNTFGIPQIGVFSKALYLRTIDFFARAIRDAGRTLRPCTIGTASIRLDGWSHNRRKGNTAVQPDLTVTRIDSPAGPLAVLVNWTAHPTFMDAEAMMFSGDWPGHMQRTVEALIGGGSTALYYNGAQGDQSPIARPGSGGDWEKAERYGRELGIQVWKVWHTITPKRTTEFAYHVEPISLPARRWHPDFMKTGGAEYGLNENNVRKIIDQMQPVATHSICLRLGDLFIAGVPGEMAATLGDQVKARISASTGARHVVIGGLADEWISYILSPEEYRKGGYEASVSFYGESLGPVVVEGVVRGAIASPGVRLPMEHTRARSRRQRKSR